MSRLFVSTLVPVFFAMMQPVLSSEQFLELSAPKNANLQVIGSVPPKRHIDLDLGELRTESAQLPDGERDLEARKRLRARRALARQNAVTNAKRDKKAEAGLKENSTDEEKEVAKADKPKIIKSYKDKKKKNRKGSSGGSGTQSPPNTNSSGPGTIE